jgi:hypothetical protein
MTGKPLPLADTLTSTATVMVVVMVMVVVTVMVVVVKKADGRKGVGSAAWVSDPTTPYFLLYSIDIFTL